MMIRWLLFSSFKRLKMRLSSLFTECSFSNLISYVEPRNSRRWPSSTTSNSQLGVLLKTGPNSFVFVIVSYVVTRTWYFAPVVPDAGRE